VVERLLIDHVGHFGDGVALAGGGNVYVPYTLGGETVEVEAVPGRHPDRRRLLAVEHASPERITPFCRHFGVCGGCAIQHWEAEPYRAWKRNLVVETLAQAKLDCDVDALIDAHGRGRRRITLHARIGTHDVLKVGFAAAHSHDIIPVDRCPILDPGLNGALEAAWAIAEALGPTAKPLDIQITATDSGLDVDVRGSGPLPTRMIAADPPWRTGADAHTAFDHDRRGARDLAAGLVPAGDRRRRGSTGGAGRHALQARQAYRRSVLRGRPVCAEAGGAFESFSVRQRGECGRGTAEGGPGDAGIEAGQGRSA
jgi:tRNA/tmRNA/rRNA uracil-C5-methylase (TrmA/RlmC/RlmD family)